MFFNKLKLKELQELCQNKNINIKYENGKKKTKKKLIQELEDIHCSLNPMIKWSGGKKDEIKYIIPHIPEYKIYVEPFVGAGALFFYLNHNQNIINDVHPELINFYKSIQKSKINDIYKYMENNENTEENYYKIRNLDKDDKELTELESACRFFYLRKTCYRGMLRYNKKGQFNIPFGKYKTYEYDILKNEKYEKILKNTIIHKDSFEKIFEKYNDEKYFFFLDPPYDTPFNNYGFCDFGRDEHKKLFKCFKNTKSKCLLIISETDFIRDLYKDYIVDTFDKKYRFRIHSNRVNNENIDKKHFIIKNY